jgi:site-specific DNA-methyltransferase (adenine-specific)
MTMMMTNNYTIYQGNCIDVMKGLPSSSVRLILADPPYGSVLNEAWDKIKDYPAFTEAWINECKRILTDDGSIYVWCSIGPKSSSLIDIANVLRRDWFFQDMIVWKKQRGRGNRRGWLFTREEILWATKHPKAYLWNKAHQYSTDKYDPSWIKRLHKEECPYKRATNVWTDIEEVTIEMARTSGGRGNRDITNKAQKPLRALERIILAHTEDENDVVLDPFLGSAQTMVACYNTKRSCIGIELDAQQIEDSINRQQMEWFKERLPQHVGARSIYQTVY